MPRRAPLRSLGLTAAVLATAAACAPAAVTGPAATAASPCDAAATPISQVQGSGATTPLAGQEVSVEGVVTAVLPSLSGVYVQEPPQLSDRDPGTSEGVFVYRPSGTAPVGTTVRVSGRVGEYATSGGASQTQIASATLEVCPGPAVTVSPTVVRFPLDSPEDLERVEGMLVRLPQRLVISDAFQYDRFGEVLVGLPLPGRDRLDTPTAVVRPGRPALALAAENDRRVLLVDDGRSAQNPDRLLFPGTVDTALSRDRLFRLGDTLTGITGVVDQTFGSYRVQPTADAAYARRNPRPAPPRVGGQVQVAGANVLNYFLTLDRTASGSEGDCGPSRTLDCRGADTAEELTRQRAKLVAMLAGLDADVVGLSELENTPGVDAAGDLAAGLDAVTAPGRWAALDTGVIGTDAIRVGMLYQPAVVRPVGRFAVLDSSVDPRFVDTLNRPSLAQTFEVRATGARFTVVANHLKSKGSSCADVGDPDRGDGQGNCAEIRTRAAEALADWVATDPTGSGDRDVLLVGDLNSYDHEDPIRLLRRAGFVDLVRRSGGEHAYSYVFDGQVGYLDHALATRSLARQVTRTAEWHVNADEPDVLDYDTTFKPAGQEELYAPDPYRASDHDPIVVGLDPRRR